MPLGFSCTYLASIATVIDLPDFTAPVFRGWNQEEISFQMRWCDFSLMAAARTATPEFDSFRRAIPGGFFRLGARRFDLFRGADYSHQRFDRRAIASFTTLQ
jgi:hypothetical protein